jgi:hypothetical protein
MRMEYRTRKCSQLVNLTNFDCRHDVGSTQDVGLSQDVSLTRHVKLGLIEAYGAWVQEQIDEGWDGYLSFCMRSTSSTVSKSVTPSLAIRRN